MHTINIDEYLNHPSLSRTLELISAIGVEIEPSSRGTSVSRGEPWGPLGGEVQVSNIDIQSQLSINYDRDTIEHSDYDGKTKEKLIIPDVPKRLVINGITFPVSLGKDLTHVVRRARNFQELLTVDRKKAIREVETKLGNDWHSSAFALDAVFRGHDDTSPSAYFLETPFSQKEMKTAKEEKKFLSQQW